MGKKYLLLAIIVFFSVFTYAQNYDLDLRWKVIDTPVIFPDNFTDWIKRNIGEMLGHSNVVITEHYLSGVDNERATDINKHIL
ncbi:MAG: hypothetical protein ACO22Y_07595 [Sediminibacterium sp.]